MSNGNIPDGNVATIDYMASLEFDAWIHEDEEWCPPSNEEWRDLANPHLIMTRVAWISLYKTKVELIEVIEKLEAQDMAEGVLKNIDESAKFFEAFVMILRGAEARMLSAASWLALKEN